MYPNEANSKSNRHIYVTKLPAAIKMCQKARAKSSTTMESVFLTAIWGEAIYAAEFSAEFHSSQLHARFHMHMRARIKRASLSSHQTETL